MKTPRLRRPLALLAALAAPFVAARATFAVPTNPITAGTLKVKLQRVATVPSGDNGVDFLTASPGDDSRLFVNGRAGRIELIKNGTLQATPFLNLTSAGVPVLNSGSTDERGLLGLAFAPGYSTPGSAGFQTFFTYESETTNGAADFSHPEIGTPAYQNVVRKWTVSGNADVANAASTVLLRINKLQTNHNGGVIRFGPDGNLYVGIGDGGGGDDNSGGITSTTDGHTNNTGNGQDTTNVYGKILRIDPFGAPNSANGKYAVPNTNPFFSTTTGQVKEIYAYGLRNPWRMSFAPNGALYAADVGQGNREEIDTITSGMNYGWPYNEGTLANGTYSAVRPANFADAAPLGEYTHGDGIAVIGGFVYRGNAIPGLAGKYLFGDYLGKGAPRLFYMDAAGGTIQEFLYDAAGVQFTSASSLFGIGEDNAGNLYATMSNGDVLLLVPEPTGLALVGLTAGALLGRRRRREGRKFYIVSVCNLND